MGKEKEKEKKEAIDIVIETPRGCRNKYAYDPKEKAFRLTKILPAGAVFPFDFGFIPKTKGEDGDPLDVLVIMDEAAYPGCVISCRIIGALRARQTEGMDEEENDRLIGVSIVSNTYNDIKSIRDLNQHVKDEISHFFVSYNEMAGKKFTPLGWADEKEAAILIKEGK